MDDHSDWWPAGNRNIPVKLKESNLPELETNIYTWHLYKGKYIGLGVADVSKPNLGAFHCPSMDLKDGDPSGYKFPQVYGTQYNHNHDGSKDSLSSGGLGWGYKISMPGWNTGRRKYEANAVRDPISPSQRVLLCDNMNKLSSGAMVAHLFAFGDKDSHANALDLGKPYFLHGGRTNLLTVSGGVVSVDVDVFRSTYYFPFFGQGTPISARAQMVLLDTGEVYQEKN